MDKGGLATNRSYQQFCGLASALDLLGGRWTLLIIRELLMGPRRYSELLAGLPGIGTNLLAERLKFLMRSELIRKVDTPADQRQSYELTAQGHELRPIVLDLARWGMRHLGELGPDAAVRPHWGFLAVEAMLRPGATPDVDERYEFQVDGEVFHIDVRQRVAHAVRGPAREPAMTATTDAATFVRLGAGELTPLAAMVTGRLAMTGDVDAVLRCCTLLGLETGQVSPGRVAAR